MFVIPATNPIAFTVFSTPIYWYGITMALAILVSALVGNKLCNCINSDWKKDFIISYAPILILIGLLGARLYFCLLNAGHYLNNPFEILDFREGGLSIHGALIFGILGVFFIAYYKKVSIMKFLDVMSCSIILGQAVGRFGNYFNSEAYGLPVSGQNWGLFIPVKDRLPEFIQYNLYHPAFLYESFFDCLGFGILLFIYFRFGKKFAGLTFSVYLILYALIRFFVEQIRIDSALNIGSVPIAQIVSVVLFLIGIVGVAYILNKSVIKQ